MARIAALAFAFASLALPSAVQARHADDGLATGQLTVQNNYVDSEASPSSPNVFQSSTQAAAGGDDTVDNENVALARSSNCTSSCYSSAVAVQVVIYTGSPTTFTPQNLAVAVNQSCDSCGSFAYAWQYVVQSGNKAHLTGKARHELQDIESQIDALTTSTVPVDLATDQRLTDQLNGLTAQIKAVVDDDLASHGFGHKGDEHRDVEDD